jgi:hypothetical protein
VFQKNFADELAVIRPATPRKRANTIKRDVPQSADESNQTGRPAFIPPINIEPAPGQIPASLQMSGNMSRPSMSSLHPYDDTPRASLDTTTDKESEALQTVRSQDRRSFTSRITGAASVKSIRKTLSFRGRKGGEIP